MGQTLMPETRFERLDPRAPLPQPTVRHVGAGWDIGDMRVERLDRTTNLPFESLPPAEPQPLPERPSDAELRKQLQIACDAQKVADETLRRAEAAHERAEHHLQKCQRRLAEFATLDDEIAANTLEALRCDAGRLSPDLSEEMELRIADREKARTELAAAEHAAAVLLTERAEASAAAGRAAEATDRVACAVLNSAAEGIAARFFASMREAERCVRTLAGFDMYATGRGVPLPGLVTEVLMAEPRDLRIPVRGLGTVSPDAWHRAGDRLKADTAATIAMDDLLPPATPHQPPMMFAVTAAHTSAHAVKIADLEPPAADPEEAA
jgi:hypothetical protein